MRRDSVTRSDGHGDRRPVTRRPDPNPLPVSATPAATPTPQLQPQPQPPAAPRAIADFTTLPAASACVRGRKLTLTFKRPPTGYTVKTVSVKVNGKRVATLSGARLKKPLLPAQAAARRLHGHGHDHPDQGQGP